ncbi:hypothetical protein D5086_008537 [Populus alba]|uniref:Uncharacterized protein n=1 Tax=Populus alba TaxID=43335 RepID=A0ACC4CFW7_POPAL
MKYLLYCIRICARTNLQVFQGLWNPRSQTIEAILQLQNKTSEFSEKGMITRLLVPSSKAGCNLGQGGNEVECSTSQSIYFADFNVLTDDALIFFPFSLELGYYLRTLHDENAGAEPERAGPVLGFGLAHNLLGIGHPPSVMMGASNSGGYEPLKANNSPNMNRVLEAYNSHNGMDSVIRSGGCDVSIIDEVVGTRLKLLHPIMVVMKLRITDLLSI